MILVSIFLKGSVISIATVAEEKTSVSNVNKVFGQNFTKNLQIQPALPDNFLTLRVWESAEAIQDDKYLTWQKFGRNDNNMEGMTTIQKE